MRRHLVRDGGLIALAFLAVAVVRLVFWGTELGMFR